MMDQSNYANLTESSRERVVTDFLVTPLGIPVVLGRVNYAKAHMPLSRHVHGGRMEFVYVAKGRQYYRVDGVEYAVEGGEIFFTHAGEIHDSSSRPEEKALFYYLIVDIPALCCGFLGCGSEGEAIAQALSGMKRRVFKARPDTRRLLDGMLACAFSDPPFRATMFRNLISNFLLGAIECEQKGGGAKPATMGPALDHIEQYIEEELTLAALAALVHLSVPRFKSSFRRQAGIPPREYVLRKKVDRAKALLAEPSASITEVAYRLQFSSSQYFATVFKRYAYVTPREYRESIRMRNEG